MSMSLTKLRIQQTVTVNHCKTHLKHWEIKAAGDDDDYDDDDDHHHNQH